MMIKILKLLFSCLFIMALSSCQDNAPVVSADELVGTWTADSFEFTVDVSTTVNGQQTDASTSGQGTNIDYEVTFTENTFSTEGGYSYGLVTEVNGSQVSTTNETLTDVTGSGSYSIDGDQITISGAFFEYSQNGGALSVLEGDQTATFEITSDDTMVFTQNDVNTTTNQGVETTTTVTSTSTWTKQ